MEQDSSERIFLAPKTANEDSVAVESLASPCKERESKIKRDQKIFRENCSSPPFERADKKNERLGNWKERQRLPQDNLKADSEDDLLLNSLSMDETTSLKLDDADNMHTEKIEKLEEVSEKEKAGPEASDKKSCEEGVDLELGIHQGDVPTGCTFVDGHSEKIVQDYIDRSLSNETTRTAMATKINASDIDKKGDHEDLNHNQMEKENSQQLQEIEKEALESDRSEGENEDVELDDDNDLDDNEQMNARLSEESFTNTDTVPTTGTKTVNSKEAQTSPDPNTHDSERQPEKTGKATRALQCEEDNEDLKTSIDDKNVFLDQFIQIPESSLASFLSHENGMNAKDVVSAIRDIQSLNDIEHRRQRFSNILHEYFLLGSENSKVPETKLFFRRRSTPVKVFSRHDVLGAALVPKFGLPSAMQEIAKKEAEELAQLELVMKQQRKAIQLQGQQLLAQFSQYAAQQNKVATATVVPLEDQGVAAVTATLASPPLDTTTYQSNLSSNSEIGCKAGAETPQVADNMNNVMLTSAPSIVNSYSKSMAKTDFLTKPDVANIRKNSVKKAWPRMSISWQYQNYEVADCEVAFRVRKGTNAENLKKTYGENSCVPGIITLNTPRVTEEDMELAEEESSKTIPEYLIAKFKESNKIIKECVLEWANAKTCRRHPPPPDWNAIDKGQSFMRKLGAASSEDNARQDNSEEPQQFSKNFAIESLHLRRTGKTLSALKEERKLLKRRAEKEALKRQKDQEEEDVISIWVQCDKCEKWRRVDQQPDESRWECSMKAGLSCDDPEDATAYEEEEVVPSKNHSYDLKHKKSDDLNKEELAAKRDSEIINARREEDHTRVARDEGEPGNNEGSEVANPKYPRRKRTRRTSLDPSPQLERENRATASKDSISSQIVRQEKNDRAMNEWSPPPVSLSPSIEEEAALPHPPSDDDELEEANVTDMASNGLTGRARRKFNGNGNVICIPRLKSSRRNNTTKSETKGQSPGLVGVDEENEEIDKMNMISEVSSRIRKEITSNTPGRQQRTRSSTCLQVRSTAAEEDSENKNPEGQIPLKRKRKLRIASSELTGSSSLGADLHNKEVGMPEMTTRGTSNEIQKSAATRKIRIKPVDVRPPQEDDEGAAEKKNMMIRLQLSNHRSTAEERDNEAKEPGNNSATTYDRKRRRHAAEEELKSGEDYGPPAKRVALYQDRRSSQRITRKSSQNSTKSVVVLKNRKQSETGNGTHSLKLRLPSRMRAQR